MPKLRGSPAANEELKIQRRRQAALEAQKATSDSKLLAAAEERNLLLNSLQEGIFGISELGAITFINKVSAAYAGI
jgi:sensor histidine kinase regulating citrate/malate metabolism